MSNLQARVERWWLIDLDGVVWLGDQPIPGLRPALDQLAENDRKIAFFTNNSFSGRAELHDRLKSLVGDDEFLLLSSAQAAASLLRSGERAYVLGGAGIVEALHERGVFVAGDDDDARSVDAVLVGLDRALTYDRLSRATAAVRAGARLIGTNDDPTYPTSRGLLPGGGAILAAVATAAGERPVIAGKPHDPAVALAKAQLGTIEMVVGDRPSTDGLFAHRLEVPFGLVRSGVTAPNEPVEINADLDGLDLKSLVAERFS